MLIEKRIEDFREIIEWPKFTFFHFVQKRTPNNILETSDDITSTRYIKDLTPFLVDLESHPDISKEAEVETDSLVIFKNGKELARYLSVTSDQMDYLMSLALSGLMGDNGEVSL